MIGDPNRVDSIERGEVSITENKIRIIPDEQASVDITGSELILSESQSQQLVTWAQDFLRQVTHLYYNPQNKAHLEIRGDTICHINARTVHSMYPHGILTNKVEATYYDTYTEETEEIDIDPLKSRIPMSAYADRLPDIDMCSHCLRKAVSLGLLPEQNNTPVPVGNPHPPCPECGVDLQICLNYMDRVEIQHTKESLQCPANDHKSMLAGCEKGLEPNQIEQIVQQVLGLTHISSFPEPIDPEWQPPKPEHLPTELELTWEGSPNHAVKRAIARPRDNENDPTILLKVGHPEFETPIALRYSDIGTVINNGIDLWDNQATREIQDEYTLPGYDKINRVITAGGQRLNEITEQKPSVNSIPEEVISQSLSPIQLGDIDTPDIYSPRTVADKVEEYRDKETGGVRSEEIEDATGSHILGMGSDNPDSRHYHQRLLDPDNQSVTAALKRLTIPRDGTYTVFGGYTGEFAATLGESNATVYFTDPMKEWVENAQSLSTIDEIEQVTLGEIPPRYLSQSDCAISFECYHPISGGFTKTLYNILKALEPTHGLVFVTSHATLDQMKNKYTNVTQFRSRWKGLVEAYEDLTLRYIDTDDLRYWHLQPGDQSTENQGYINRVRDRLTLLQLLGYADPRNDKDTISTISADDREHNNKLVRYCEQVDESIKIDSHSIDVLTETHPLCQNETILQQSLARLLQIFKSQQRSEKPRSDALQIGTNTYILRIDQW